MQNNSLDKSSAPFRKYKLGCRDAISCFFSSRCRRKTKRKQRVWSTYHTY